MKIYRNIYFTGNIIINGHGNTDVKYYGLIFGNAKRIKNFNEHYNQNLDLCIVCNTCAAKQYRNFIKVNK